MRKSRAHQGLRQKFGDLELILKFRLSLARALSSVTLLELVALISNFAPFLRFIMFYFYYILGFKHKCICVFRFFPELVLVDVSCKIS